jgi:sortase B
MKLKKKAFVNFILNIIFILCLIVFLHSFLSIIKWEKDNRMTTEKINNLQDIVNIKEDGDIDEKQIILFGHEDEDDNSNYWYYASMNMIDVNLDKLLSQNNDTRGWISVGGTDINYPFVQSSDNKFYLNRSFDKTYNDAGWVFLDYRNNINNLSKNNILYAHARVDRTMFGSLRNVLKNEWLKNKDNHVIKLSTLNENSLWQIFSVYSLETESYYITTEFKNDADFQKYINKSLERSRFDFNVNLNVNDIILTLSTCHGEKKKLVVHAKLIKKEIKNP